MRRSPRDEMLDKLDAPTKQKLLNCFESSDCVPLPCPCDNDQDLGRMDAMSFEDLAPRFKEEFMILERQIFNTAKVQKFGRQDLTGPVLAEMLNAYIKILFAEGSGMINDIEKIPTQADILTQIAGERAQKEALDQYKCLIEARECPLEAQELSAAHLNSRTEAIATFESIAYCDHKSTGAEVVALELWNDLRALQVNIASRSKMQSHSGVSDPHHSLNWDVSTSRSSLEVGPLQVLKMGPSDALARSLPQDLGQTF
jgi:hypothetical protein